MGNLKIKQTLNLSDELSLKASQIELTATSARLEALLDAVYQDRVTGETYLKYKTNATSTNTVEFPASVNWKGGVYDIEVYVNSIKIPNDNFTYTAGSSGSGDTIVFNANSVGYEIDTNDIIEVVGVIFAVVLGYPTAQLTGEPYSSTPVTLPPDTFTGFDVQSTSDNIYAMAVDDNGYVYAGGIFTSFNGVTVNRIIKLTPAGEIDTTFDSGTGFDNRPWTIKIGPVSGNILVGGQFTTYDGNYCRSFAALDPTDGSFIRHYDVGRATTGYVLEEFNDGTVLAGGSSGVLKRFSANGVIDNTFSFSTGTVPVRAAARFGDGKYIISRQISVSSGSPIVITDEFGTIDTTATANLQVTNSFSEAYAYGETTNTVFIGTGSMKYGGYSTPLMKVGSDGIFDVTFATNASKITTSQTVEILYKDGFVFTTGTTGGGGEYPYNIAPRYHIFDTDGNYKSFDNTFIVSMFTWAGALTPNNTILVGGSLKNDILVNFQIKNPGIYESEYVTTSWSVNSEEYNFQNGFDGVVYALEKYQDKLLVGGELNSYNGVTIKSNLVRLNTDGTLDYTFAPTNITGKVNKIRWIFGTDVVLVGGAFNGYLKAYNSNGSENTDWTTSFDGEVKSIWYDRYKEKVVVAGAFTGGIKVFDKYGTLDTSINIGTGFNGRVNDVFWENQRSKRMVVVGNFTEYNGTVLNVPRIALINEDGSLYTNTVTGTGFNGEPYCIMPNSMLTQYYIGGNFTDYNGNGAGYFAYIQYDNLQSDAVGEAINDAYTRPNQFNGPVHQIAYLNNRSGVATYNQNYLVVGDFTQYQVGQPGYGFKTITAAGVARIGSGFWDIPSDWNEGVSTNGPVYAAISQYTNMLPDTSTYNNWIVGGDFTQYDGTSSGSITQFTTNSTKLN